MASQRAMERRMAVLFVLALVLIAWQAWQTEPLPAVPFTSAIDPGGLVFPVAVPSWREPPRIPEGRDARRAFLEEHSVGATAPRDPSLCQLFLRISSDHWLERAVSARRLAELTLGRPGRPGPEGSRVWSFQPSGLLDDDDGDGDFLDPGELTSEGPGAEAEVFCAAPPPQRAAS
jgi:hypothetical protein